MTIVLYRPNRLICPYTIATYYFATIFSVSSIFHLPCSCTLMGVLKMASFSIPAAEEHPYFSFPFRSSLLSHCSHEVSNIQSVKGDWGKCADNLVPYHCEFVTRITHLLDRVGCEVDSVIDNNHNPWPGQKLCTGQDGLSRRASGPYTTTCIVLFMASLQLCQRKAVAFIYGKCGFKMIQFRLRTKSRLCWVWRKVKG